MNGRADMGGVMFAVFPCRGKVPLTKHGCKDATRDVERIRGWEKRWPDANWAIATGSASGGLLVVDVDGIWDAPGEAWTRIANDCGLNGPRGVRTVTVLSGSGHSMHWYFRLPDGVTLGNSTGRLAAGIDTRGEGGYVICPPSMHPDGQRYEWRLSPREVGVAPAPRELLELLEPTPRQPLPKPAKPLSDGLMTAEGKRRMLGIIRRVESASKGERHDVVFWAACRIGELVATNHVDATLGVNALFAAVDTYALSSTELKAAERTIRDGLGIGGAA